MRPLLVLLLLTPAFVGCLGGSGDALDPSATDGAGEVPTLPEGLEMEGAEVVEYTDRAVTWRWTGTLGPAGPPESGPASQQASTTFELPAAIRFAIGANLSWPGDSTTTLGLQIQGPGEDALCSTVQSRTSTGVNATCTALPEPLTAPGTASVTVETYMLDRETEFTLDLRLSTGVAGVDPTEAAPAPPRGAGAAGSRTHTVIGFGDTGINPYHQAYRDDSPEAFLHPSTYIDGYPEDAVALNLTLQAPTYVDAIGADAELWAGLERGQLYWIPGTKIIGAYAPDEPRAFEQSFCRPVLDCIGHGSGMAARAVSEGYGLCDTCKLVEVQGYQTGLEWMTEQTWIDIHVLEYCQFPVREDRVGDRAEDEAMVQRKPTFVTGGNGILSMGAVGAPYYPCHHEGLPSAIPVGGYNDGRATLWSNSVPPIVADLCSTVPRHNAATEDKFACGESLTAPYAAGAAGALVQTARAILGDDVGGVHDGVLARGAADSVEQGPIQDGELTIDELERLLFTTADPRPGVNEHDGPTCAPTNTSFECLTSPTTPVEWQTIPEGVPAYYFIGYGAVTPDTLEHAERVLRGEEPMPARPVEDAFFALDQEVRRALVEVDS